MNSKPVSSSNRRWIRRIAVLSALLIVAIAAWVLPAIYHARYDPATNTVGAVTVETSAVASQPGPDNSV